MNAPAGSSRKIQTGLFQIDLIAGQVHESGRRAPLQEQPFRVLAMLLERKGRLSPDRICRQGFGQPTPMSDSTRG
jgi:DNA-binding response OmpR family regulator